MKKKLSILLLAIFIMPIAFMLSACGQNVTAESILIELTNGSYVMQNNNITLEWGEKVTIPETDFRVTVEFSDGSTKVVTNKTATEGGYTFTSTLPTNASDLENGKTPIGVYTITFEYPGLDAQIFTVNVTKKNVDIQNLTWTDSSNFVYDGTQKTVQISSELPNYVEVSYQNNAKTDAGEYTAVANFVVTDEHYQLLETSINHQWEIQKAEVNQDVLDNISLIDAQFTYSGNEFVVEVDESTLPAGFVAEILSGGRETNAGDYVAVVRITPTDNYNAPNDIDLEWHIAKANVNVQSVALEENDFDYDGQQKVANLDLSTIPSEVTAQIVSGGSATNVGTYHAVVEFTLVDSQNYNQVQSITLDWNISKNIRLEVMLLHLVSLHSVTRCNPRKHDLQ